MSEDQTQTGKDIASVLMSAPILDQCDPRSVARLIPHCSLRTFAPGEKIVEIHQPADQVYLIHSGSVDLYVNGKTPRTVSRGFVGEEAALNAEAYLADAVARDQVIACVIGKEPMQFLTDQDHKARTAFYSSLINHYTKSQIFDPCAVSKSRTEDKDSIVQPLGWILALVVPTGLYAYLSRPEINLDSRAVNYLTIFSATTIMWVFRLLPEYIPALFIVLASIILGVVQTDIVLSGFASGSFFMAMSVFGIAAVLIRSGLTYRVALLLLQHAPRSQLGYEIAMFLVGFLLTPILPSANGRISLIHPLMQDFSESIQYKRGSAASTRLTSAGFNGATMLSAMFLTSKPINFAVYDLLPPQVKFQFTWGSWIAAAAVAGAVLIIGHFVFSMILFRSDEQPRLSSEGVAAQLRAIGPLSRQEWIALGGIVLFVAGALTSSFHKIQPPWIGLAILYALLALGFFSKGDIRKDIDWPFLLMLAGMVSIVKTMDALGLSKMMESHLTWMGAYMRDNFFLFILVLSVTISLVRTIVPNNAAIILMCTVFLPIADSQGINAWIIAFIVLLLSDGWFMSYQSTYYIAFHELSSERGALAYNEKRFLQHNLAMTLLRLVAVFASIPYWQWLGYL